MPYLPVNLQPGVYRAGTEYQSQGRYYDADLVRWYQGALRPIGGWRELVDTALTGAARALYTWRANNAVRWVGVGTHSKLYAIEGGVTVYDITPAGFVAGRIDASADVGYGRGPYGEFSYGDARPTTATTGTLDATVWSLDNWGQNLVGCSPDDGKLYEWALNTANDAVQIANSPEDCYGLLVTAERILVAIGAEGNPRLLKWSDQEDNTLWTPASTNQAGDFELSTPGSLRRGLRVRGGSLYLTDTDAWLATYQGPPLVYTFDRVGAACGLIGNGAAVSVDTFAVWMGESGFWIFDGYTKPLPCTVAEYVFSDLNRSQGTKVVAVANTAFGEVTWYYPSGGSVENDRYVTWNSRENHWTIGRLARTAGDDSGVFENPLMASPDGYVWVHEIGWAYPGAGSPFAEAGPIELGAGDSVMMARQIIPDERTSGQVSATFFTRFYPNAAESTFGPYSLSERTDVRFTARQVNFRVTGGASADWRVGVFRLDLVPGGLR